MIRVFMTTAAISHDASRGYRIKNVTRTIFLRLVYCRTGPAGANGALTWLLRVELSRPVQVTGMAGIGAEQKLFFEIVCFRFCEGFRMPAPGRSIGFTGGSASESLQGRNPRWAA